MNWLKEKKRGVINILVTGGGWLNKGIQYEGWYEVDILEETEDLYKVSFKNSVFQRNEAVPKWWDKNKIKLIK